MQDSAVCPSARREKRRDSEKKGGCVSRRMRPLPILVGIAWLMRMADGDAAFARCSHLRGTGWRGAGAQVRLRPCGQTWLVVMLWPDRSADEGTRVGSPMPPFRAPGVANMRRRQQSASQGLVNPCAKAPRRIAMPCSVASTHGLKFTSSRLLCPNSDGSHYPGPPLLPSRRVLRRFSASATAARQRPNATKRPRSFRTDQGRAREADLVLLARRLQQPCKVVRFKPTFWPCSPPRRRLSTSRTASSARACQG